MMSASPKKVNLSPQSFTASWPNFFQGAELTSAFSICISTLRLLAQGDSEWFSRCACMHIFSTYSILCEIKHVEIFYFEFLPDKHISVMIKLVCISNSSMCFKKTESYIETNHLIQFKIIIITTTLVSLLYIKIFYNSHTLKTHICRHC